MCGLVFSYHAENHEAPLTADIKTALAALAHRGPDAGNTLQVGPASFAHARLSIIDLDESHQPMQSPDGRYTLVFNGEIYNHHSLRERLARHWPFHTQGDTEVLLAGLIRHGTAFLEDLEGMWAFALWDARERELLLSRDRMGKKPLFYFGEGKRFACASELPALRQLADAPWQEDIDSTADYFRYGYLLPGYTAWQGVREVLPGHWLKWRPGHSPHEEAYWRLPTPGPDSSSFTDDDLRERLEEAVGKRLLADVEVGACLSGGIDSSLVCALAQRQMDRPLKTYTIGFSEAAFDESEHAAEVARFLGTDHHKEMFHEWDENLLEALLRDHVGQPFMDSSLLPTAMVSRLASRDVKVALSGDGADELFGGYQRYQARLMLRWYTRLPGSLKRQAEKAIRMLPEPTAHHSRSLLKKAHLFVDVAQRQRAETPYTAPVMFHPDDYATLFPDLADRGHPPPGLKERTELDDLQQMLTGDALVYLPQDIHTKVDRASMAASLETRAPFMDHKVVELAFSRPAKQHLRLGAGKRWLRSAFHDLLPEDTWKRRKQGFGVPIHQWFRSLLGDHLEYLLWHHSGPISVEAAINLLDEHRSGARDHGYRLWMLYAYLMQHHATR